MLILPPRHISRVNPASPYVRVFIDGHDSYGVSCVKRSFFSLFNQTLPAMKIPFFICFNDNPLIGILSADLIKSYFARFYDVLIARKLGLPRLNAVDGIVIDSLVLFEEEH